MCLGSLELEQSCSCQVGGECPSSELLTWQPWGEGIPPSLSLSLSVIPEKPALGKSAVWAPFLGEQMPRVSRIQIYAIVWV